MVCRAAARDEISCRKQGKYIQKSRHADLDVTQVDFTIMHSLTEKLRPSLTVTACAALGSSVRVRCVKAARHIAIWQVEPEVTLMPCSCKKTSPKSRAYRCLGDVPQEDVRTLPESAGCVRQTLCTSCSFCCDSQNYDIGSPVLNHQNWNALDKFPAASNMTHLLRPLLMLWSALPDTFQTAVLEHSQFAIGDLHVRTCTIEVTGSDAKAMI